MTKLVKSIACALMLAAIGSVAAVPASAAPSAALLSSIAAPIVLQHEVELAQFRGDRGRGRGDTYRRGGGSRGIGGGGIALGIGAAIIGGIVLSEAARAEHRSSHGGDWDRCAQTYRSFEPDTGLYTGYDGVRRTCPYLR